MQISPFSSRILIPKLCQLKFLVHRTIYTAEQLSIEKYVKDRNRLKMNMTEQSIETIKINLRKHLRQRNVPSWTFINEMTQFLHLINNTDDDFILLEEALKKFENLNADNLRKSNIGSILMKVMHHYGRDELAQKIYTDPKLKETFLYGQQSNLVFFDLLYKQTKYSDLIRHFEEFKESLSLRQRHISRSIFVLVFATCYAQNTPASFEYAKELHEQQNDSHITKDHLIFLSALAINQNAPDSALKYLSLLWPTAHIAINSLRIRALLQMHRFVDSIQTLRSILVVFDNNRMPKNDAIASDVIKEAERLFTQFCDDERLKNDFHHLQTNLQTHGYIVEKKLDDLIFVPFRLTQMTKIQRNRMFLQAAFDQTDYHR